MRRIGGWLVLLTLGAAGCLYMPPPPSAVAPIPEGDTSFSLHVAADLAGSIRGEPLGRSLGFYPSLRYALTDDQEVVFYPWPAYRHWSCTGGDRIYHQVSLGSFLPFRDGRLVTGAQYLRYDVRICHPDEGEVRWCDPPEPGEESPSVLWGAWVAIRGATRHSENLGTLVGLSTGYGSERYGATLEPALLLIPWTGEPAPLLPEARLGLWGGE